jgi:hypothetical protein
MLRLDWPWIQKHSLTFWITFLFLHCVGCHFLVSTALGQFRWTFSISFRLYLLPWVRGFSFEFFFLPCKCGFKIESRITFMAQAQSIIFFFDSWLFFFEEKRWGIRQKRTKRKSVHIFFQISNPSQPTDLLVRE